jgi:hypothetical protein
VVDILVAFTVAHELEGVDMVIVGGMVILIIPPDDIGSLIIRLKVYDVWLLMEGLVMVIEEIVIEPGYDIRLMEPCILRYPFR